MAVELWTSSALEMWVKTRAAPLVRKGCYGNRDRSATRLGKVPVKGSKNDQIAMRYPTTMQHVKAKIVNKLRGRKSGSYKSSRSVFRRRRRLWS